VENDRSESRELWELPDTSILFRRYMDSGRVINVYDWLESFAVVLESQRQRGSRRKGKKKEDEEGKWKMEVQARFMRALQELDYLGLMKHTGRKADHVIKTVLDINPD
jgi:origin recognition complex subunit 3